MVQVEEDALRCSCFPPFSNDVIQVFQIP